MKPLWSGHNLLVFDSAYVFNPNPKSVKAITRDADVTSIINHVCMLIGRICAKLKV